MSIIQSIRDRGALISAIVIALALLGFIAMDASSNGGGLFGGGNSTAIGSINGEKIDYRDFQAAVEQQENILRSQGYPAGEMTQERAIQDVWNQRVNRAVLEVEFDRAGISVSNQELNNSILFSANPSQEIRQIGTDPNTGVYDPAYAFKVLNDLKNSNDPVSKAQVSTFIDEQILNRKYEKYLSLLTAVNAPKWMLQKQSEESSLLANITFTRKPYIEIPDSSVSVSDKEIAAYVNSHKDLFTQEESRNIAYVAFSALPSAADSMQIKADLEKLKQDFATTTDLENFLMVNGTDTYYKGYINGKGIFIDAKDSIFRTPVGSIYGPYLDGSSYALAKVISTRQIPDSVKVRHILISTTQRNPQTGQMQVIRDSATAMALMDSVKQKLASGMSFDEVCRTMSEDPGSKDNGGVYETASGQMVPEFNDFIFTNSVGTKGVVKTDFGFHYIEIMSQKGSGMGYKIAYVYKPIYTGAETEQLASNNAAKFAAEAKDEASFNETLQKNWEPQGYYKRVGFNVLPEAFTIMGLNGSARPLVRNIYNAKRGQVLDPIKVGDEYIVAVVTDVFEKGTQPIANARVAVEPILKNQKKANKIIADLGQVSAVDAAAAKWGKSVEVADSVRFNGSSSPALVGESKVIGAAFNEAVKGGVAVVPARQAVYVVSVNNVSSTPVFENIDDTRRAKIMQLKQAAPVGTAIEALRKAAKIKDNRSKFY